MQVAWASKGHSEAASVKKARYIVCCQPCCLWEFNCLRIASPRQARINSPSCSQFGRHVLRRFNI